MTKARKVLIATFFRARLNAGDIAKVAVEATRREFRTAKGKRIGRSTIYRVCKQLKIKTT